MDEQKNDIEVNETEDESIDSKGSTVDGGVLVLGTVGILVAIISIMLFAMFIDKDMAKGNLEEIPSWAYELRTTLYEEGLADKDILICENKAYVTAEIIKDLTMDEVFDMNVASAREYYEYVLVGDYTITGFYEVENEDGVTEKYVCYMKVIKKGNECAFYSILMNYDVCDDTIKEFNFIVDNCM